VCVCVCVCVCVFVCVCARARTRAAHARAHRIRKQRGGSIRELHTRNARQETEQQGVNILTLQTLDIAIHRRKECSRVDTVLALDIDIMLNILQ